MTWEHTFPLQIFQVLLIQSRWHLNWRVHLPGIKKRFARFMLNTTDFCGESLIAPQDEQAHRTLLAAVYA
jgi:hypothetical protein